MTDEMVGETSVVLQLSEIFPTRNGESWTPTLKYAFTGLSQLVSSGEITPNDAKKVVSQMFSFVWNSERWEYETLNSRKPFAMFKNNYGDLALKEKFLKKKVEDLVNTFADPDLSNQTTENLRNGLIEKAEGVFKIFEDDGQQVDKTRKTIQVKVIDKPREWWVQNLGTTSAALTYREEKPSILILPSNLDGLEHEMVHCMPGITGFSNGKYRVIGNNLEETIIDLLVGTPRAFRNYFNELLIPIFKEMGSQKAQACMLQALRGKPDKLFKEIISKFDMGGLAMMLLVSETFNDFEGLPGLEKFNNYFNRSQNNPYYKEVE